MPEFTHLLRDDMRHVLRAMPKDARSLMREIAKRDANAGTIFLAGGAIRAVIAGEPVSDWDFLAASAFDVDDFVSRVKSARNVASRLHKTRNATTLLSIGYTPVQGITRWRYSDPGPLLGEFDFTIAQAVMWFDGEGWRSLCSPDFYPDLAARRLRYTSPTREEDAGGSMLRVMKFLRRGYSISPEDLGKVIARLASRYQPATGIECEQVMIALLREVDPLTRFEGLDLDDGEGDPLREPPDDEPPTLGGQPAEDAPVI